MAKDLTANEKELVEKYRKEIKQHIVDTYGAEDGPQYEYEYRDIESILTRLFSEVRRDGVDMALLDAVGSERFLYVDSPLLFESQVAAQSVIFHNQQSLREIVNEFHYRLTALERAGGTKPLYLKGCEKCNKIACECPQPTPVMVERFRVYGYDTHEPYRSDHKQVAKDTSGLTWAIFSRKPIGTVVASPFGDGEMVVEYVGHSTIYHVENYIYEFFRDMMLKSGVWEHTNG